MLFGGVIWANFVFEELREIMKGVMLLLLLGGDAGWGAKSKEKITVQRGGKLNFVFVSEMFCFSGVTFSCSLFDRSRAILQVYALQNRTRDGSLARSPE